jgi:hypothetical protein
MGTNQMNPPITKRDLCIMFNLNPNDVDYVAIGFHKDAGGEDGRLHCGWINDETFASTLWGQIEPLTIEDEGAK